MALLYLLLGLGGLLVGAEMAVHGSLALARRWNWPAWVAGVILLALGTSLPELFVAIASAQEHPGLAFGTVMGSNAINVGGVLGLMLILQTAGGIPMRSASRWILGALLGGSLLCLVLFQGGEVHAWVGVVLVTLYAAVLALSLARGGGNGDDPVPAGMSLSAAWTFTGVGFVLLAFGSNWFLRGALGAADALGWGDGFTGYLIAAAGTSAPELFTSIQAMRRGQAGAVFGNVLGSNAFNLLLVGGVSSMLAAGRSLDSAVLQPQLVVNLIASVALCLPLVIPRREGRRTRLGVLAGVLMVSAYVASAWWIGLS